MKHNMFTHNLKVTAKSWGANSKGQLVVLGAYIYKRWNENNVLLFGLPVDIFWAKECLSHILSPLTLPTPCTSYTRTPSNCHWSLHTHKNKFICNSIDTSFNYIRSSLFADWSLHTSKNEFICCIISTHTCI